MTYRASGTRALSPFPSKPPAYDRTGVSIDDLIDFTPDLRAAAVKLVSRYKLGPMFTPPVVSTLEGPLGTLTVGTKSGGSNWPGGSYDPETHILYVFSQSSLSPLGLIPTPDPEGIGNGIYLGHRRSWPQSCSRSKCGR